MSISIRARNSIAGLVMAGLAGAGIATAQADEIRIEPGAPMYRA